MVDIAYCESPCGKGCHSGEDNSIFTVELNDTHATVKRVDKETGWGMALQIPCYTTVCYNEPATKAGSGCQHGTKNVHVGNNCFNNKSVHVGDDVVSCASRLPHGSRFP